MKNTHRIWERLILTINRVIDIDNLLVLYQSDETIDKLMTKQYTRHKQQYINELENILGKNIENPYLEIVQFAENNQLIDELSKVIKEWANYSFLRRSDVFYYASDLIKNYHLHHQKNYSVNFDREMIPHLFVHDAMTNNHRNQTVPKLQIEYVG